MTRPLTTRPGQTPSRAGRLVPPSDHESVTKAARGVADRSATALAFDAATRTFTITPVNGAWSYYISGRRYIVSTVESIVIADTSGPHWIYYDGATLSSVDNADHDTVDDLIVNKVRIGIVYWNATDVVGHLVADERHGCGWPGESQEWVHNHIGAVWHEGLALSGYALDTDSDAGVDFEVADGGIEDEDLAHAIADGNPANQYEQQLNGGNAEVPIAYRDDVDGAWTQDAATTLPYKRFGAGRLAYNKDDGDGTWSQVEVTNNRFVLATLVATNDWQYPIKMVQGQAEYTDKKTAIEEANAEQVAWGTMITPEIVPLYRLVMETGDALGGTNKCKIVSVTDLRRLSISGGLTSPAEPHSILNGATHIDSVAAAVTDGALVYGNTTPEWAKHALVTLNAAGEMAGLTKLNVDNLQLNANVLSNTAGAGIEIVPQVGDQIVVKVTGVATADIPAWGVQNYGWNAAMIDTRTSIAFAQAIEAGGVGVATLGLSGRITVGTETDWAAAVETQDSYMAFFTAEGGGALNERVRINSAGAVGINTIDPGGNISTNLLDIRREGERCTMGMFTVHDTQAARGSSYYGGRARGTTGDLDAVHTNDTLFTFVALGFDVDAVGVWRAAAQINFVVDGAVASGAVPTTIHFRTGPTAATIANRFSIQSDGDILVDSGTSVFVRDSALGFNSSVDGQLNLFADVECEITAPTIELIAATAVLIDGDNGINYAPGADIDVSLVTVDVTGAPTFWWDESADTFAMTKRLNLNVGGIQTRYVTDDVADPPTDAELDAAFGDPTVVGAGFVGILDDNGAGADCYVCWTTGAAGEWFYAKGAKAV